MEFGIIDSGMAEDKAEGLSAIFNSLGDISENREKYNLQWAYKNAQDEFNSLFSSFLDSSMKHKVLAYYTSLKEDERARISGEFSSFSRSKKRRIRRAARESQMFSLLSSFVILST